ncbi:MAG TPA: 2-C-methyl-D-erythritol 4-phosphate cytidylyltransferase [Tepidisphaeraceae bacterium]|jgi:2-C-methyl-D-erythritol 4-phosphate cytidylyltransferase/2-C-methyl-D-erythritol 2,4-cyclodiphosphate synthase
MSNAPDHARFSVIFPAGGASRRFGSDKLSADLAGLPVIARAIASFAARDDVLELIVATDRRAELEPLVSLVATGAKLRWCRGGASRAATVRRGVEAATGRWVAVHDAARPATPADVIDRVFAAAISQGAAAPALPVKLTIKQAIGPLPAQVLRTLPRDELFEMQTPQAMRRIDLLNAYDRVDLPLDRVTDDVQLLELAGVAVLLVAGDERNLKITTPADLIAAAAAIQ